MDLSTTYLGFTLPHPLMPGASPLADSLDSVRRLEDAGAGAGVECSVPGIQGLGSGLRVLAFWSFGSRLWGFGAAELEVEIQRPGLSREPA